MKAPPDPTPPPDPNKPCCGTCCNAQRSARTVGHVICTAFPPQVVPRGQAMAVNVYPELPADKLGCTTWWNVNAQLFHILGQAVTLATQSASNDDGKGSPEKNPAKPSATGGPSP